MLQILADVLINLQVSIICAPILYSVTDIANIFFLPRLQKFHSKTIKLLLYWTEIILLRCFGLHLSAIALSLPALLHQDRKHESNGSIGAYVEAPLEVFHKVSCFNLASCY